jgi:hypothetical protein
MNWSHQSIVESLPLEHMGRSVHREKMFVERVSITTMQTSRLDNGLFLSLSSPSLLPPTSFEERMPPISSREADQGSQ